MEPPRPHPSRRARSARARFLPLALVTLIACRAEPARTGADAPRHDPAEAPAVALPPDWAEVPARAFEDLALELLPGEPRRLDDRALDELAAALAEVGPRIEVAVRAAVLLARANHPRAIEVLLARLEQRARGPDRNSDAGDVTAAAGLSALPEAVDALRPGLRASVRGRLAALAVGPRPHPDLEVRVECGRAALLAGDDSVVPFLLSVLRIGTRAGRAEGTFWPAPLHSAWCRERAAEALALRAGVENTYSADASLDDRDAVADRFAAALAGVVPRETTDAR